jgi:multicomponent K+:H+ antiporter subunit F
MTEPSVALLTDATVAAEAVTGPLLAGALGIGFLLVSAALLMSLARLVIGPDKPDRILALDTLYVNTVALLVLLGIHLSNDLFFEAALLIALIGFIGTVALAKFLTRGDIIE